MIKSAKFKKSREAEFKYFISGHPMMEGKSHISESPTKTCGMEKTQGKRVFIKKSQLETKYFTRLKETLFIYISDRMCYIRCLRVSRAEMKK